MKTTDIKGARPGLSLAAAVMACLLAGTAGAMAEVINRGIEGKPLHEARPAPKSIFPD